MSSVARSAGLACWILLTIDPLVTETVPTYITEQTMSKVWNVKCFAVATTPPQSPPIYIQTDECSRRTNFTNRQLTGSPCLSSIPLWRRREVSTGTFEPGEHGAVAQVGEGQ